MRVKKKQLQNNKLIENYFGMFLVMIYAPEDIHKKVLLKTMNSHLENLTLICAYTFSQQKTLELDRKKNNRCIFQNSEFEASQHISGMNCFIINLLLQQDYFEYFLPFITSYLGKTCFRFIKFAKLNLRYKKILTPLL